MGTKSIAAGTKRPYLGEHTRCTRHKHGDDNTISNAAQKQDKHDGDGDDEDEIVRPTGRDEDYYKNLYSTEPDFYRLGLKYPDFGAMLGADGSLDFTDPMAVMQLTKTLLKEDFGLEINLPADRLCPPVPNRHNYILWLKDLLDSTSSSYSEQYEPGRRVTGLDIGTGASLIYPLLGCAQRPAWHFIATDIDPSSLSSARANARLNNLKPRIRIVDNATSDSLIPLEECGLNSIDFVMTNPPFYASAAEMLDLASQKSLPPHSACTGAPIEMVCEGGEVGFVERMINESLVLRDRVQWYTAMLGRQSSLEVLVDILRKHKIHNLAATTFIQGNKTRRWAIAWSFLTRRPSLSASRGCGSTVANRILPSVTAITIRGPFPQISTDGTPSLQGILRDTIESLDLRSWTWDDQHLRGVGFSDGNVWNRAYRRKKAQESTATKQATISAPVDVAACAFGFAISVHSEDVEDSPSGSQVVEIRWLQGDDDFLFESFCGLIRRCLRTTASCPA